MKKFLAVLLMGMFVMNASAQEFNDANAEPRDVKNFHGIRISSAFDLYILQGTAEGVAVSAADPDDRARITTEIKDGILVIGMNHSGLSWKGNKKLKAYVSVKTLDKLDVSGACDIYIKGVIKGESLEFNMSGASDLREGKIDYKTMKVDLSGASDMTVTGTVNQLTIEVSGASTFSGVDLVTEICDAHASGASDVKVTVSKELSAHASGASDIKYRGPGVVKDLKVSGASGVKKI